MMWRPIHKLKSLDPDELILAKTADGRIMMWRVSILLGNIKGYTPNHLQFPATHFIPRSELALLPTEEEQG